jgi:N-acetylneuraminic acid mutarotase
VMIGGKIYVPGGKMADGQPTDQLEVYDPRKDTWEKKEPLPVRVSGYALAALEGKMYLFGGWDGKNILSSVYKFDPTSNSWQLGRPMPFARIAADAFPINEKIYIFGGSNDNSNLLENLVYLPYRDENEDTPWEKIAALPDSRYVMGGVGFSDLLYIFSGKDRSDTDTVPLIYSTLNGTWQYVHEIFPENVRNNVFINYGDYIYLIGGKSNGIFLSNTLSYQALYKILIPGIQN